MFLFTTPSARESAPTTPIVDAIRTGAARTGAAFDYLLRTAQRESALDPAARAKTSSATGLFQFVEQTWLGILKADGAKHGLEGYAKAISARPDGSFGVEDPAARKAILALREDPTTASVLAGSLTQRNRDMLASELGREPSPSDLYLAHFLGARGATDLIRAAQSSPQKAAAADFPEAAAANRRIFYDRSGRPRGAGEVYALLSASHGSAQATAAPAFAPDRPVAFARAERPALQGLFQTGARGGPVSEAVARLWRVNNEPGIRTAALGAFFPRNDEVVGAPAPDTAAAQSPATTLDGPPLPPPRPAELTPGAGPARPLRAEPSADRPGATRALWGKPLDLQSFMKWRRT